MQTVSAQLSAAPIFSGITFGYRLLESVKATWCWREMGDEGIKREVWEGKVPVCFSVAEEEVGLNRVRERVVPEPCYVSRRAECLVSGMSPRGVVTGQYHKIGDLGIIFFATNLEPPWWRKMRAPFNPHVKVKTVQNTLPCGVHVNDFILTVSGWSCKSVQIKALLRTCYRAFSCDVTVT